MNQKRILSWVLLGTLTLSACGGGNAPAGNGAVSSGADISASSQPPAQSAAAPIVTAPDVSTPAVGIPGDASLASSSQEEPEAGQVSDSATPDSPSLPPAPKDGGKTAAQPKNTAPAVVSAPQSDAPAEPEEPQEELGLESSQQPAATKETASAYIGKSVSSLIAAIGQPRGSDYAPSCMGDGEDGELFYDGFTVYTYRVNGTETVLEVM